jgi:hypothetical protein
VKKIDFPPKIGTFFIFSTYRPSDRKAQKAVSTPARSSVPYVREKNGVIGKRRDQKLWAKFGCEKLAKNQ